MTQVVSITSQGQMTIPKAMLEAFGIKGSKAKALVRIQGKQLIVQPQADFWALAGSMKSDIVLTDEQLRAARRQFEKEWADPA